jgi:hypothetical protein
MTEPADPDPVQTVDDFHENRRPADWPAALPHPSDPDDSAAARWQRQAAGYDD